MRHSRRASAAAAQTLTTASTPGPFCAHCALPLLPHPAHIRCAAPQCLSLPLCLFCYSVGAHALAPHHPAHPYRLIERLTAPIYAPDWSAHEELRLLHALADHGPDHWKAVADYVKSKSLRKCQAHYAQVYLDSPTAPLPSDAALYAPRHSPEPASPAPLPAKGDLAAQDAPATNVIPDHTAPQLAPAPLPEPPSADGRTVRNNAGTKPSGSLEGFMPLRGDFDVEWDDKAEELIADLVVSPQDTPEEVDLKARLLEMYDTRLKRREAVKDYIFDSPLLSFDTLKNADRRGSRDEKELSARLKVFSRLLGKTEYETFHHSVMTEYRIAKDVYKCYYSRARGVRNLSEIDIYEIERRVRASRLADAAKRFSKSAARRRSGSKSSKGPKRHRPSPICSPSPSQSPLPGLASDPLRYTPLGNGTPAGGSESGSLMPMDPPLNGQDAASNLPNESKTASLRKARELKRIMRSPYPKVSAMPISALEDSSELTVKERTLCSALHIPPKDFLKLRDAMLYTASQDITQSAGGHEKSLSGPAYALRATRSRANALNAEPNGSDRVNVIRRPMTRGFSTATRAEKVTETPREVIVGPHHRVKVVKPTRLADTEKTAPDTQTGAGIQVTEVELERVQTRSRTPASEPAHINKTQISRMDSLKQRNTAQRGKAKRSKAKVEPAKASLMQAGDDKLVTDRRRSTRLDAVDEANKRDASVSGGVQAGVRGFQGPDNSSVLAANGSQLEHEGHSSEGIKPRKVDQTGVLLKLTLRLPKPEEQGSLKKPSPRKEAVSEEVTPSKEAGIGETGELPAAKCNLAMHIAKQVLPSADEVIFETEEVLSSGSAAFSDTSKGRAQVEESNAVQRDGREERTTRERALTGSKNASLQVIDLEASVSSPGVETEVLDGSHAIKHRRNLKFHAQPARNDKRSDIVAPDDKANAPVLEAKLVKEKSRHKCAEWNVEGPSSRGGDQRVVGKVAARDGTRGAELSPQAGGATYVEFADKGITEEILDEGRADSFDRRSLENALEDGSVSSEALDVSPRIQEAKAFKSPSGSEDNFLVIAPRGRNVKHSLSPQVSTRTSESEGSNFNDDLEHKSRKVSERRVRTRLTLPRDKSSEPEGSSVPSSPEDEDTRDKDYQVEEDFEEEQNSTVDIVDVERRGLRQRARNTNMTPPRKSTRLGKRRRKIEESPDMSADATKASGRKRGRPPKAKSQGGEIGASGRKPPTTPVRTSARKRGRAALVESAGVGGFAKWPRAGSERYSLRRRA